MAVSPATRLISSIWRSSSSSGRSKSSVWVAMASPPGPPLRIAERGRDGRLRRLHDEWRLLFVAVAPAVAARQEQHPVGADHLVELGPRLGKHQRLRRAMEVLERESRVLGARLLGDLSLHHRHHRRDPSLLLAPLAQRGGGARTEKLHLGAVPVQWMPGNEEPEHGLLAGEPFVLR